MERHKWFEDQVNNLDKFNEAEDEEEESTNHENKDEL